MALQLSMYQCVIAIINVPIRHYGYTKTTPQPYNHIHHNKHTYTTTNTPEYSAITKRDTTTQHDILLGLRCMSTDPARDFRVATCAPGGVFETMIIFVSPYSLV